MLNNSMQSLLDKFVKPENAVKQFLIQLDKKKPTTKESLSGSHGSVVMMRYIAYCQKKLRTALIKSTSPQSAEALRTNDKGDIILSTQGIMKNIPSGTKNFKKLYVNLPDLREIYHLLLNIDSSYNTEDGQIRFLEDNRKKINLGDFWSIITPEMKQRMTYWSKISMPFEDAKDLRTKLLALSEEDISKYNTEDGQIRFLEDNHKINSLADFWTLIPQEIKEKMTHWKLISLPFKEARDLRHKLLDFTDHKIEKYNTEDGQIRFLEDNRLTINLEKFRSIIPQEIKEKMTHWKKINLSFKKTKDLQKKILSLTDDEIQEYNNEDGQIRFLEDNGEIIHLGHFWSIIPQKIKKQMTRRGKINLPIEDTKDLRAKLLAFSEEDINKYNTKDGQIRFLEDNKKTTNLGAFRSIIPYDIRKKMTKWQAILLSFENAKTKYQQ